MIIIDTDGNTVFEGSYTKLLNQFNTKEECDNYIEDCKEMGYEVNSRTCYYDFEYDTTNTSLSKNWFEDIKSNIAYELSYELIEGVIEKSFKTIKRVRCQYIGNKYLLIVLPKKYDSLIMYTPEDINYKFFSRLLKEIYLNINGRHNKMLDPKIRVIEFVDNWRQKTRYADYNEGYTFYYNSIPQENRLNLLLK